MSKLIACKDCGNQVSKNAKICPNCGAKVKKGISLWGILGLFIVIGIIGNIVNPKSNNTNSVSTTNAGNTAERKVEPLGGIYAQVASDAIDQYNIAKKQGDAMQICVQAGMVTAALLQAKDEEHYNQWKKIEKADCRRAGVVE